MAVDDKVIQESLYGALIEVTWMLLVVEKNVLTAPEDVTGGCAWAVMAP